MLAILKVEVIYIFKSTLSIQQEYKGHTTCFCRAHIAGRLNPGTLNAFCDVGTGFVLRDVIFSGTLCKFSGML
jgi:hypothetical protein